ncbi:hemolysin family protein [Microbacterium sp. SSW1-59]|uniref:hemolysin family protein n=1 Tax=Microbacterium xanthum TaxID=3079794 RepID=UPI002AD2E195|nr:hemolysin family protein [Microbacterium sp. SSW1-59]MDZ8200103.1 hemolysin family protein [Microbacterium sp. SSW1-59]
MSAGLVVAITIALIALSAFFVVIEFALLAVRRHRLEEQAQTSRSARAALKGANELTLMLAGAQLGITACTFALGAVTKPAVDKAIAPILLTWGLPEWGADVVAFAVALLVVTFLHLVVGEMAPKSWAIAHPERAAKLIGIPSRAFVWVFRPLLLWVNRIANRLVAASGVEPVDRAAAGGLDVDAVRQLVEHSTQVGALEESYRSPLAGVIDLRTRTIGSLLHADAELSAVDDGATVGDIRDAASASGHMRILVRGATTHVVHVRDVLLDAPERPAADVSRRAFTLDHETLVHEALTAMRRASEQLAVITRDGRLAGVVTIADILREVLPPAPVVASGQPDATP